MMTVPHPSLLSSQVLSFVIEKLDLPGQGQRCAPAPPCPNPEDQQFLPMVMENSDEHQEEQEGVSTPLCPSLEAAVSVRS